MNIRNCVIMRRGEKQVLCAYIRLAHELEGCADMRFPEFRRHWQKTWKGKGKNPDIDSRADQYITEVWVPLWTGEKKEIRITNNQHEGD